MMMATAAAGSDESDEAHVSLVASTIAADDFGDNGGDLDTEADAADRPMLSLAELDTAEDSENTAPAATGNGARGTPPLGTSAAKESPADTSDADAGGETDAAGGGGGENVSVSPLPAFSDILKRFGGGPASPRSRGRASKPVILGRSPTNIFR